MGNLVKVTSFYLTVFNFRLFRYSLNSSKVIPWVSFEFFSFTASLVFIYIFEEV